MKKRNWIITFTVVLALPMVLLFQNFSSWNQGPQSRRLDRVTQICEPTTVVQFYNQNNERCQQQCSDDGMAWNVFYCSPPGQVCEPNTANYTQNNGLICMQHCATDGMSYQTVYCYPY